MHPILSTNFSEINKEKLENRYLPKTYESKTYGSVVVTNCGGTYFDDYNRKELDIKRAEPSDIWHVIHIQFKAWPLNGILTNEMCLINFCQMVNSIKTQHEGPHLVHCGNGISRSGLYIALDMLLKELTRQYNAPVDKYLSHLRREGLISSIDQSDILFRSMQTLKDKRVT